MFVVMVSSLVPDHLRGYLSRFVVEVEAGTFVGKVSPSVADHLWERGVAAIGSGRLTQIRSAPQCEQGFEIRTYGQGAPTVYDFDGIQLIARRQAAQNGEVL